jgi:hypothetical protein
MVGEGYGGRKGGGTNDLSSFPLRGISQIRRFALLRNGDWLSLPEFDGNYVSAAEPQGNHRGFGNAKQASAEIQGRALK